jgi:hypothetical protein
MVTFYAQAPAGQKPATADPYANNPEAGKQKFPLAAPAGKDSGAKEKPLARRRQHRLDRSRDLEVRTEQQASRRRKLWNPVKVKLQQGGKVTGGTVFSATDPLTYCAMANAGYDFIWTGDAAQRSRLEPGREDVAHLPAREGGSRRAPRIRAMSAKFSTPPTQARSSSSCRRSTPWKKRLPRATGPTSRPRQAQPGRRPGIRCRDVGERPGRLPGDANDNIVLISDDRDARGIKNAHEIAKVQGVDAVFAASGDLGQLLGLPARLTRLRAAHQRRARRGACRRQEAVRPIRVARPGRFHVLPGRQRNGCHRRRRSRGTGPAEGYTGEVEVGPLVQDAGAPRSKGALDAEAQSRSFL